MRDYSIDQGLEPWPEITIPPVNDAPAVVFLLSDAAEGVNGQVIRVEGEHLSLMTHPSVLYPAVRRDRWTEDEVLHWGWSPGAVPAPRQDAEVQCRTIW
jgi:hypothetical protein